MHSQFLAVLATVCIATVTAKPLTSATTASSTLHKSFKSATNIPPENFQIQLSGSSTLYDKGYLTTSGAGYGSFIEVVDQPCHAQNFSMDSLSPGLGFVSDYTNDVYKLCVDGDMANEAAQLFHCSGEEAFLSCEVSSETGVMSCGVGNAAGGLTRGTMLLKDFKGTGEGMQLGIGMSPEQGIPVVLTSVSGPA